MFIIEDKNFVELNEILIRENISSNCDHRLFLEKISKMVFIGKYDEDGRIVDLNGNPFDTPIEEIIKGRILTEFFKEFLRQLTNPHNNLLYKYSPLFMEDYFCLQYYHTGEDFKYYLTRNYKDFRIDKERYINFLNFWDEEISIQNYLNYLYKEFAKSQEIKKLFGFKAEEVFPWATVAVYDEDYEKILLKTIEAVKKSLNYNNCLHMKEINNLT